MQFSKLLLALFLFVALTAAVPVPLFESIFNKDNDGEKKGNIFDIFKKKDVESAPAQESTQETSRTQFQAPTFDINNISEDADVASIVTDLVSQLIKNNLCSTLGNGVNNLCEEISASIINSISGVLNNVIKTSINSATGNTISIACSIIPNELFKTLSGTIASAISSSIAKNGSADPENVSNITNNVITIIINTVEHLLCSSGSTSADGNVIVNNISNLINNITHKASYMNSNVSSNLVNGSELVEGTDKSIADGFSNIQNSIKMQYKASYKPTSENYENNNYQSVNENYRNFY